MPATAIKKPTKKPASKEATVKKAASKPVAKKFNLKVFKEKKAYPWSKWANGKEHVIVMGKDFDTKIPNMTSAIYGFARRHGATATIHQVDPKTLKFSVS
jgi:hypothetical protein